VGVLIGLAIGFAIGATGVGGGTLMAPALILIMGFSPRASVATALVYSTMVKIWASGIYLWRRKVDFGILARLLAGGLPGAIVGALAMQHLRTRQSEGWILTIVGTIISLSATASLFHAKPNPEARPRLGLLPALAAVIGLESGFSSAGAGALGSVILFNLTALSPAAVVGTDLVFGMITSGAGGTIHALAGNCAWKSLMQLVPAGIVGTLLGTYVSYLLPAAKLRTLVLMCAIGVGGLISYKGIRVIFP
jgi:uncharacterized protein